MNNLTFMLSGLPISVNCSTIVRWGRKINSKDMNHYKKHSKEAILTYFSTLNEEELNNFIISLKEKELHLSLTFGSSWYTKKGKIKKQDSSNLLKSVEDTLIESLNCWSKDKELDIELDDRQIFTHTLHKIEVSEEITIITLEVINGNKEVKEII